MEGKESPVSGLYLTTRGEAVTLGFSDIFRTEEAGKETVVSSCSNISENIVIFADVPQH